MIEASLVTTAGGELPFLREMIAIFAVGTAIVYVCHRLRLPPIVGFLLTGVLIGPYSLGLVRDIDLISSTAEVGVILLLFTIGVEFSVERLSRIRRYIVLGGGLQVVATIGLVTFLLALLGVEWRLGVYTGYLVALSSTAIVLKLLSDRARIDTPTGQPGWEGGAVITSSTTESGPSLPEVSCTATL